MRATASAVPVCCKCGCRSYSWPTPLRALRALRMCAPKPGSACDITPASAAVPTYQLHSNSTVLFRPGCIGLHREVYSPLADTVAEAYGCRLLPNCCLHSTNAACTQLEAAPHTTACLLTHNKPLHEYCRLPACNYATQHAAKYMQGTRSPAAGLPAELESTEASTLDGRKPTHTLRSQPHKVIVSG